MDEQEPLIPAFMPTLVSLLLRAENDKGSPLTKDEVLAIRDGGVCIMLPRSTFIKVAEKRGYDDIDPQQAWERWQIAREQLRQPPETNSTSAHY